MLRQECKGLPVNEGEQGLVARRPHPVPRSVEGVGHRRAQHVVQVDLSHLKVEHMRIDNEKYTNNSDGCLLGGGHTHTHQADLVQCLPKQLMVDFRFCIQGPCCHFSNNKKMMLQKSQLFSSTFHKGTPPGSAATGSQTCHCQLLSWQLRVSPDVLLLSATDIFGSGLAEFKVCR